MGPFQITKNINKNEHEFNLPHTYLGSINFHVSNLIPFSIGVLNLWMDSLQPGEHDETLMDKGPTKATQPFRRMTRNMTRNSGLG